MTLRPLLKLKPYLRPYWHLILVSALLAIPLSLIRLGPAPIIKYILDEVIVDKSPVKLRVFSIGIIALYLVNLFIRWTHYYFLKIVIIRVDQKIKNDLFGHLLGLSADYFTKESTGALISRTAVDPQYVSVGIQCITTAIREPLTLVFLLGYAFYLNWQLTLIIFAVAPALAYVFSATGRNLKRYMLKTADYNSRMYSTLQEGYTGVRVIKTFRLEKYISKRFRIQNESFAKNLLKTSFLEEFSHPFVELVTSFALAPLVYFGGMQVLKNTMSAGDLLAFFATFALMMNPIRMMNDINIKANQAAAACQRIFEVFDWKPHVREPGTPKKVKGLKDSIQLKDVSFSYPDAPNQKVLSHVSFSIPKGRAIAIIGASGAGKSSLVSLIPRIFDVTGGVIEWDGIDLRELSLSDLRRLVAVVSQDVFLFNDTIEENIRCGRLSATPEEIRSAAEKAHALDFIEKMPHQFQTVIGDRGQKLSGGERQRLSIARAFLSEAPVLILDEATSSLDSHSERIVQLALDELMQDRTTLMIAHRLSTIQHADLILVLKDGKIVEQGPHADLIQLQGEYAKFLAIARQST